MGTLSPASALADSFFVYILRCADGTLYVGHTSDLQKRIVIHNEGKGATWTACRRPIQLVYHEHFTSESRAMDREHQLKRWSHAKKLALLDRDLKKLKSLAKRRGR